MQIGYYFERKVEFYFIINKTVDHVYYFNCNKVIPMPVIQQEVCEKFMAMVHFESQKWFNKLEESDFTLKDNVDRDHESYIDEMIEENET